MTTAQRDLGMAIAMLVEAFRVKEVTPVLVKVYERTLKEVPGNLLIKAVEKSIATRQFFPKPAEILVDAETCRQELLKANPYQPCVACERSPGWEMFKDASGFSRVRRCGCYRAWQAKVEALGVGNQPVALLERGKGED